MSEEKRKPTGISVDAPESVQKRLSLNSSKSENSFVMDLPSPGTFEAMGLLSVSSAADAFFPVLSALTPTPRGGSFTPLGLSNEKNSVRKASKDNIRNTDTGDRKRGMQIDTEVEEVETSGNNGNDHSNSSSSSSSNISNGVTSGGGGRPKRLKTPRKLD